MTENEKALEKQLIECINTLQSDFEKNAKPYYDALAELHAIQLPTVRAYPFWQHGATRLEPLANIEEKGFWGESSIYTPKYIAEQKQKNMMASELLRTARTQAPRYAPQPSDEVMKPMIDTLKKFLKNLHKPKK